MISELTALQVGTKVYQNIESRIIAMEKCDNCDKEFINEKPDLTGSTIFHFCSNECEIQFSINE